MSLMYYFSSKWRLLKPLASFPQEYSVFSEASFTLSLHPLLWFLIEHKITIPWVQGFNSYHLSLAWDCGYHIVTCASALFSVARV